MYPDGELELSNLANYHFTGGSEIAGFRVTGYEGGFLLQYFPVLPVLDAGNGAFKHYLTGSDVLVSESI